MLRKHSIRRGEIIQSYLMISLSVIGLIAFVIYPLLWILRYCLFQYSGFGEPVFVGLDNFIRAFSPSSARFWQSVLNTFVFAFGKLLVEIPLALVLAYILSRELRGRSFFRTVFFLPSMLSVAVMGIIFYYLFGSYNGVVNEFLKAIGLSGVKWFSSGPLAMLVLMITSIWQNFGVNMLFFMTGLQSIPNDIYEAADIDGAKETQKFFRITIPMLGPVLQMVLMNALLGSLKVTDLVLVLTDGKPTGKTEVMMSYIYKLFFASGTTGVASDYGFAAALVLITAIILGGVTFIYLKITKKSSEIY